MPPPTMTTSAAGAGADGVASPRRRPTPVEKLRLPPPKRCDVVESARAARRESTEPDLPPAKCCCSKLTWEWIWSKWDATAGRAASGMAASRRPTAAIDAAAAASAAASAAPSPSEPKRIPIGVSDRSAVMSGVASDGGTLRRSARRTRAATFSRTTSRVNSYIASGSAAANACGRKCSMLSTMTAPALETPSGTNLTPRSISATSWSARVANGRLVAPTMAPQRSSAAIWAVKSPLDEHGTMAS